jgi:hypothetical protein
MTIGAIPEASRPHMPGYGLLDADDFAGTATRWRFSDERVAT